MLSDDLLALQGADTALDQLGQRRARLAEREAFAAAEQARTTSTRRAAAIAARQGQLAAAVEAAEAEGAQLTKQRERLEAKLKTVISPREAEALMHELDAVAARRDALDDTELAHLEEESQLADERAELEAAAPAEEQALAAAAAALRAAEAEIDAEVASLEIARAARAAALDAARLADYERRRRHHGGVAVATLDGRRCRGCSLDLSTSEFEQIRAGPPGEVADCPQCGRLLVP